MLLNDSITDRKAKPRTFTDWLGSEEGIEDFAKLVRLDPATRIDDGDNRRSVFNSARDSYLALILDGLCGVYQKICPDLVQLTRKAIHRW